MKQREKGAKNKFDFIDQFARIMNGQKMFIESEGEDYENEVLRSIRNEAELFMSA